MKGLRRSIIERLTDLFGLLSNQVNLRIERRHLRADDRGLPPTLTDYGKERPTLRFKIVESHPADRIEIVDAKGNAVPEEQFDLRSHRRRGVGDRHPRPSCRTDVTSSGSGPSIGRETKTIRPRSSMILSDHTPPNVEILEPVARAAFKKDGKIEIRVRVRDAFSRGARGRGAVRIGGEGDKILSILPRIPQKKDEWS